MTTIQRVLSIPFPFLRSRVREDGPRKPSTRAEEQHRSMAAEPRYSRKFRLERECARYRSIHFPR